ncbi:hypothetical protein WIW49_10575 [Xanthomonas euroxanthea]
MDRNDKRSKIPTDRQCKRIWLKAMTYALKVGKDVRQAEEIALSAVLRYCRHFGGAVEDVFAVRNPAASERWRFMCLGDDGILVI